LGRYQAIITKMPDYFKIPKLILCALCDLLFTFPIRLLRLRD